MPESPSRRSSVVTDAMVERAAIALWDDAEARDQRAAKIHFGKNHYPVTPWDRADPLDRDEFREKARTVLTAVLDGFYTLIPANAREGFSINTEDA